MKSDKDVPFIVAATAVMPEVDRANLRDVAPAPRTHRPGNDSVSHTFSAAHWFEYAFACEHDGRLKDAVKGYERAIALDPHWPEAHFNLANVLRSLNKLNEARRHYQLAIEYDPTNPATWYNLGDLLDECGQTQEAIACLQRAVAIDGAYADAHFNLAACYEAIGANDNAKRHWRLYVQLDQSSEWAAYARRKLRISPTRYPSE